MSLTKMLFTAFLLLVLSGCDGLTPTTTGGTTTSQRPAGAPNETGRVVQVIDGDTIDVEVNGDRVRVRYLGVNTPERDEACYSEATAANRSLVNGQTVALYKDKSETDRFGRLLRYVFVGDVFVNRELIVQGYAESVLYEPDRAYFEEFAALEREAARAGRGCHPTGIFNDGTQTR